MYVYMYIYSWYIAYACIFRLTAWAFKQETSHSERREVATDFSRSKATRLLLLCIHVCLWYMVYGI